MIDSKYTSYPLRVLNGEIVACEYVKQACKRYLDFFNKYTFDEKAVDRVVTFVATLNTFRVRVVVNHLSYLTFNSG